MPYPKLHIEFLHEETPKSLQVLLIELKETGLHKAGILCILDTRQIDPCKTASIQNIGKSSLAEGPVCNKLDTTLGSQDIRP